MEFYRILDKGACALDIPEKTKEAALKKIAEIAARTEVCEGVTAGELFEKLMVREEQGSTGFGNGIAIPHARMEGMTDSLLFIVTSRRGLEFAAMDKKKVHVFFVLLGPEKNATEHLKMLAAISRVLSSSNVKKEILNARSTTAVYEAFLRNVRFVEGERAQLQKMKALFVILYEDEFLYPILEFFIEEGIEGATILDSSGMGEYISNIPLFASFIGFMNEDKNRSRTIIAMIPEDRIDEVVRGIEEITGDLDKKEGAMLFTLDVSFCKGTMKIM